MLSHQPMPKQLLQPSPVPDTQDIEMLLQRFDVLLSLCERELSNNNRSIDELRLIADLIRDLLAAILHFAQIVPHRQEQIVTFSKKLPQSDNNNPRNQPPSSSERG